MTSPSSSARKNERTRRRSSRDAPALASVSSDKGDSASAESSEISLGARGKRRRPAAPGESLLGFYVGATGVAGVYDFVAIWRRNTCLGLVAAQDALFARMAAVHPPLLDILLRRSTFVSNNFECQVSGPARAPQHSYN